MVHLRKLFARMACRRQWRHQRGSSAALRSPSSCCPLWPPSDKGELGYASLVSKVQSCWARYEDCEYEHEHCTAESWTHFRFLSEEREDSFLRSTSRCWTRRRT